MQRFQHIFTLHFHMKNKRFDFSNEFRKTDPTIQIHLSPIFLCIYISKNNKLSTRYKAFDVEHTTEKISPMNNFSSFPCISEY